MTDQQLQKLTGEWRATARAKIAAVIEAAAPPDEYWALGALHEEARYFRLAVQAKHREDAGRVWDAEVAAALLDLRLRLVRFWVVPLLDTRLVLAGPSLRTADPSPCMTGPKPKQKFRPLPRGWYCSCCEERVGTKVHRGGRALVAPPLVGGCLACQGEKTRWLAVHNNPENWVAALKAARADVADARLLIIFLEAHGYPAVAARVRELHGVTP